MPSPSWGLLTLPCLNWETSRLVLAPFKQYVFNNNSMYSTQCLQLDILQSALDQDDPNHILCALPTGFGKTMPMLLLGHLLPPGAGIPILETPCYSKTFQARWRWSWFLSSRSSFSFSRTARDCIRGSLYDRLGKKRIWRIWRIPYLTFFASEILKWSVFSVFTYLRFFKISKWPVFSVFGVFTYFRFFQQHFKVARI